MTLSVSIESGECHVTVEEIEDGLKRKLRLWERLWKIYQHLNCMIFII